MPIRECPYLHFSAHLGTSTNVFLHCGKMLWTPTKDSAPICGSAQHGTRVPSMGIEQSGNELNAAFARILRRHKADQRLTYDQIAERTGLSPRQVKRIFNDERVMDTDELVKSAAALKVTVSEIVNEAIKLVEHR